MKRRMQKRPLKRAKQKKQTKKRRRSTPKEGQAQAGLTPETILQLQQRYGNSFVQQQLDAAAQEDVEQPLSLAGLEREQVLAGHGLGQGLGQVLAQDLVQLQSTTSSTMPTASIAFQMIAPTIVRLPAADIAAKHGRAGVAGWCAPHYNIQPTGRTATTLALTVTLSFTIELASEYTGPSLSVLSDHEMGHVIVGEQAAREHLVTNLQRRLESLPDFRKTAVIQAALDAAGKAFVKAEEAASHAYDQSDYPRMKEAYYGAQLSLPELEAASPAIRPLLLAITDLQTHVDAQLKGKAGADELTQVVQALSTERASLSDVDLARLQYNVAFKKWLDGCRRQLALLERSSAEKSKAMVQEAGVILASFDWRPTV